MRQLGNFEHELNVRMIDYHADHLVTIHNLNKNNQTNNLVTIRDHNSRMKILYQIS